MRKTELHENPLVPDKKLRQMYLSMLEARSIDDHIERLQWGIKRRRRLGSTRGQEACRIGTAIDLAPGDLVSDSQIGVVMGRLAGEKISSVLQRAKAICSGKLKKDMGLGSRRLLPWIEDQGERLRLALGVALCFKVSARPNVVIAYVRRGSVSKADWRLLLSLASILELPVVFVVLPSSVGKAANDVSLSARSSQWGVPGIPVDSGDAMALYRVAQEALGRIRCGDGPVLIECLEFENHNEGVDDSLIRLGRLLVRRKICTQAWLRNANRDIRRRIDAAKRQDSNT